MLKMTRAELHALVWELPITAIARAHSVRARHVAQVCDAHDIARPRPGHWQKVDHGKAVEAIPLDNRRYLPEDIIIIEPAVGRPGRLHRDDDDGTARRRAA